MDIEERWSLDNEYSIARVKKLPDEQYMEMFNKHMLMGHPILPWRASLSEEKKNKLSHLKTFIKDRFEIKLALLHSHELIGWSYGWQDSIHDGDFYMASSLVLPEHRGRGLYTELTKRVLDLCEREGFSAVRSRHVCTNNPVLIAKLKLGFMINGFEQDETMGTLVRMIYHHDDLRKKSCLFRAGKYLEEHMRDVFLPREGDPR